MSAPESRKNPQDKPIVLVVDGDIGRRLRTSVYLQRLEYHVFPVGTAEDALKIMWLTVPCLVICDFDLPQVNGLEFLRWVKEDPRTQPVPVLIVTAVENAANRKLCEQAGCAGYLVPSGDHNELYEAVQKATEPTPRHFVRLTTWLDVAYRGPGGAAAACITAISEHGMFVNTPQPLPFGTRADFSFSLPEPAAGLARITGKVLYSHAGGAGKHPGMGIKFLQVGPEAGLLIKTFIRERLSEGLS